MQETNVLLQNALSENQELTIQFSKVRSLIQRKQINISFGP